jgi:hypothetical protein
MTQGIYFDSLFERLAVLPSNPRFRHFSFVQDMLPHIPTREKHGEIAQPLILFKTFCIATFATSPLASSLTHVRLRIPQRSILTSLASSSTSTTVLPLSHGLPRPFPSLEYLDISTTFVPLELGFSALLRRHKCLRHLVLDRTGIASDLEGIQLLGKTCASYGIGRKKEAERILRAKRTEWEAEERELVDRMGNGGREGGAGNGGGGDRGTAGLQATTSRVSRRRMGRSGFNSPPASFYRDTNGPDRTTEGGRAFRNMQRPRRFPSQLLIVPPAPSLVTVSYGVDSLSPEARLSWQEAFSRGWAEGRQTVVQLAEEVMTTYQRATDHGREEETMLARFLEPGEEGLRDDDDDDDDAMGFLGSLSVVACSMTEARSVLSAIVNSECVFCSIPDCPGEGRIAWALSADVEEGVTEKVETDMEEWRRDDHVDGCGHLVGRQEWETFRID